MGRFVYGCRLFFIIININIIIIIIGDYLFHVLFFAGIYVQ